MGKEIATKPKKFPKRTNPRQNTPRHIFIKLTNIKWNEQILKAAKGKQQITHKEIPIWISTDLSTETLISDQIDFEMKTMIRDKQGHYIMIKVSIQEKDITIMNIYAPKIKAPQ